jgi:hypothetical protein
MLGGTRTEVFIASRRVPESLVVVMPVMSVLKLNAIALPIQKCFGTVHLKVDDLVLHQ